MLLGDFLIFFFFYNEHIYFYNQKKKRILNKRKNSVLPHRKLPALSGLRGRSDLQFATDWVLWTGAQFATIFQLKWSHFADGWEN